MPHVQNPSLGPGQVPLLVRTVQLAAADILALSTTPFTLIPAAGAGKIVAVFGAALVYHFGTEAYEPVAFAPLNIFYAGGGVDLVDPNTIATLLTQAQSQFMYAAGKMSTNVAILPGSDNKAVQLSGGDFHGGPIVTTTLGAAGTGYAANDTGTLTDGFGDATYKILTVGALGAVLTYSITAPGSFYPVENNSPTATGGAQPGVGVGFTVNITAVQNGDGTLKVTIYYQILPVPSPMAFIFTKPRGTLVRQWPDWRLDEFCIGNFASLATGALLFQYISLFNNDNSGRAIVIWNAMFSVDQFDFCHFYRYPGTRGTKQNDCNNVSPQRAPAFGQMFFDTPASKYTDMPIASVGTLIGQFWPSNTPALVVPAGWSLAMGSDLAGSDTSVTFWYLPTQGI